MDNRAAIIERLTKLKLRLSGKTLTLPGEGCQSVDYHLAGLFLKQHIDLIIEALKRLD
jgi:hypothetical protein